MPKLCCMEQERGWGKGVQGSAPSPPTTLTRGLDLHSLWGVSSERWNRAFGPFLLLTRAESWASMHVSSFKRKQFTLGTQSVKEFLLMKRKSELCRTGQVSRCSWSFVHSVCGAFQIPKQLLKMSKRLVWGHFQSGKRKRDVSNPLSNETQMPVLTNCEQKWHKKT